MDDTELKDTQNKSEWLNTCQIVTLYKIFSLKKDYARLQFARIVSKKIIYK